MNPMFFLLSLLGAGSVLTRSSNGKSQNTDNLTIDTGIRGDGVVEDQVEDTEPESADETGNDTDTGDTRDSGGTDTSTDAPDEDGDTARDIDTAADESDDTPAEETTPDDLGLPPAFDLIFDDLVVEDDMPETPVAPVNTVPDETEVETPAPEEPAVEPPVADTDSGTTTDGSDTPEDTVVDDTPAVEPTPTPEPEPAPEPAPAPAPPVASSSDPLSVTALTSDAFGDNLNAPITLQFSENIRIGDGDITLRLYDSDGYETVERFSGNDFSVSGNQLSFSPSGGLEVLRDYAINIETGAVEKMDETPYGGSNNDAMAFSSGIGIEVPTIDYSLYDRIIDGQTFTETLFLEDDDSNTLIINSTFENIDGSGIMMRGAENVTIANSTFKNIDDFGILLRSSGSTDNVTIMGNSFEDVGGDAIHAAKRFDDNVDHTNLVVYDNELHDVASKGFYYHGIYVQSSEAVVWGNELTGNVCANGISIRGDGIVYDNYVDINTGRDYGAGIKYFSDHMTGDSKTLIIADNVVEANNLHSAIQLDQTSSNQPSNIADEDWVVNDFYLLRNDVDARNDYVIDSSLENASWATIEFIGDAPVTSSSAATVAAMLPQIPTDDVAALDDPTDPELEAMMF